MPAFPSGAAGLYEQSLTANTVSTVTFSDLEGVAQAITVWNLGSATIYAKAGATTTVGDSGAVAILAGSAGDVFVGSGAVLALISTGTPTYSVVRSSRKPSPLYPGAGGGGGSTDVSALNKESTQASVLAKLSADLGVQNKIGGNPVALGNPLPVGQVVGGALVSTANPVPVSSPLPGDVVANGTLGALNATVGATIGARDTIVAQVTGTFVGTITLQGSLDGGTTWTSINGPATWLNVVSGASLTAVTATGLYQATVSAVPQVRVLMSAYTSGTATVYLDVTDGNAMVALDAPLPAGSNSIGTVVLGAGSLNNGVGKFAISDPGGSASASVKAGSSSAVPADLSLVVTQSPNYVAASIGYKLASAASTNATSIKASAGSVLQATVVNTSAATVYVKIFDKASAPTVGTDLPVDIIALAAGARFAEEYGQYGKRFPTGIALAITGAAADSDATAVATGVRVHLTYL